MYEIRSANCENTLSTLLLARKGDVTVWGRENITESDKVLEWHRKLTHPSHQNKISGNHCPGKSCLLVTLQDYWQSIDELWKGVSPPPESTLHWGSLIRKKTLKVIRGLWWMLVCEACWLHSKNNRWVLLYFFLYPNLIVPTKNKNNNGNWANPITKGVKMKTPLERTTRSVRGSPDLIRWQRLRNCWTHSPHELWT